MPQDGGYGMKEAEAMDSVEAIRGHVIEAWGGEDRPGSSWRVHVEFAPR